MKSISQNDKRGVVYIFWGNKAETFLKRSVRSLQIHHPHLPIHYHRVASPVPGRELREKIRMKSISPFQTTLYLDIDTIVMGNLDYAFEQAERFGLACAINECPWMRRYCQPGEEDHTEYNTGVMSFTSAAGAVFDAWEMLESTTTSASSWAMPDRSPRGSAYDDQASFARALRMCNFNPFVLPVNFNYRPDFSPRAFAPLKVWHDYRNPPAGLVELSSACERGERPVTLFDINVIAPPRPNPNDPPPTQASQIESE